MTETLTIRKADPADRQAILNLYQKVASFPGGIARVKDEITPGYIDQFMNAARERGLELVAEHAGRIVAEIHAARPGISVFHHVLSDLTIVVDPDFQGKGTGRKLFTGFLNRIREEFPDILRVELIARESNRSALRFYTSLGFRQEGRFEGRIHSVSGGFEADIPMAWMRDQG